MFPIPYLSLLWICQHFLYVSSLYPQEQFMTQWSALPPFNETALDVSELKVLIDELHSLMNFDFLPDEKLLSNVSLTDSCYDDIQFYLASRKRFLRETAAAKSCGSDNVCREEHAKKAQEYTWTIQQLDAYGKLPPGILRLNKYWYGSYGECISIKVKRTDANWTSQPYMGKYCYAMLSLGSLGNQGGCPVESDDFAQYVRNVRWAMCVPNSCSTKDVRAVIQQRNKLKNSVCNVFCVENEISLTTGAIAMITLLSVVGLIATLATCVDYTISNIAHCGIRNKYEKYCFVQLLNCFSLYTNGKFILDTRCRNEQLQCLHGIRALSMLWVILGHTYLQIQYINNFSDLLMDRNDWSKEVINNATFVVDTFFTMSGFLVAYLSIKEREKLRGKPRECTRMWVGYYVHRYIRLTPVYMVILGATGTLMPYFLRGPHQFDIMAGSGRYCAENWWTNLLYINNLVKPTEQCYGPAWYLPNDMQFYALWPAILALLTFSPLAGSLVSLLLILGSIMGTAALIVIHKFPAMIMAGIPDEHAPSTNLMSHFSDYMRLVYLPPWSRFPPYLIGLLFGYAWQKRLHTVKINKLLAFVLWCFSLSTGLAIIYGLTDYVGGNPLPVGVRAFYGAVSRPAWSVCICWLIFACLSGRGGPINEFLSWKAWLPLSRLSYCIYLTHFSVIAVLTSSNELPPHWDSHMNWISKWISATVLSSFIAFFVSCCLEVPVVRLERQFLRSEEDSEIQLEASYRF